MLSTVFEVRPLKSWFDLANFIVKAIKEPKKIFFLINLIKPILLRLDCSLVRMIECLIHF